VTSARRGFVFLFLGQDGLQCVARFGDVGEIHLGLHGLRTPRRCVHMGSRTAGALELRAHLFRFIRFQRAGVRFAFTQAELRQHVKNLPTLNFHLACEIVNSYLAHPPLFTFCYPKRVSTHSLGKIRN
jgi:hypothetical protein